jgi:hypothetical protein
MFQLVNIPYLSSKKRGITQKKILSFCKSNCRIESVAQIFVSRSIVSAQCLIGLNFEPSLKKNCSRELQRVTGDS